MQHYQSGQASIVKQNVDPVNISKRRYLLANYIAKLCDICGLIYK